MILNILYKRNLIDLLRFCNYYLKNKMFFFLLLSVIQDMLAFRRFIHTSIPRHLAQSAAASNPSSPLSALRKKTGYSLSHCRAALQQFNDNLEQVKH